MKKEIIRRVTKLIDVYYKVKNRKRPKLLVYTDSRGYNVIGKLGKVAHGSYVAQLQKKYNISYAICPEKYTTILDFLNYIDQIDTKEFDAVIMHCGVVDFSPRPLSNISNFKINKASVKIFDEVFVENALYYKTPFDVKYYNELTVNIYSKEYLTENIMPKLKLISNLIWVNSNRFVKGWEGNYTKGRPKNIDCVINEFDQLMQQYLKNVVNIKQWSPEEIKNFTIDNIHFSKNGFEEIYQLIDKQLIELISKNKNV